MIEPLLLLKFTAAQLSVKFQSFSNNADRFGGAKQILNDDFLVLQDLIVLKEALDFPKNMGGKLVFVGVVGKRRVIHAHGHNLVVASFFVPHPHHAYCTCLDDGEWIYGLLSKHQDVQRISVVTIRTWNESVIGGIVDCAVENAVQL